MSADEGRREKEEEMMISDTVLVAFIAGLPPTIAALAALVVSVKNSRKVDEIKVATDGMKSALVEATRAEAAERGKAAGIESERVRAETGSMPLEPMTVKIDDRTPVAVKVKQ